LKQRYPMQTRLSQKSFYITYEELKRACGSPFCALLTSFYITYEELKPLKTALFVFFKLGFYITYEELKQRFCKIYILKKRRFLHYLWGIETSL